MKISIFLKELVDKYYKEIETEVMVFISSSLKSGLGSLTREEVMEAFSEGFEQSLEETFVEQSLITMAINKGIKDGSIENDLGEINYSEVCVNLLKNRMGTTFDEIVKAVKQNERI